MTRSIHQHMKNASILALFLKFCLFPTQEYLTVYHVRYPVFTNEEQFAKIVSFSGRRRGCSSRSPPFHGEEFRQKMLVAMYCHILRRAGTHSFSGISLYNW